jgi:polyhydroxyalkanoate synthase
VTNNADSDSDVANEEWRALFERGKRLTETFAARRDQQTNPDFELINGEIIRAVFSQIADHLKDHPQKLAAAQHRLAGEYAKIWASLVTGGTAEADPSAPVIEPDPGDRRFKDPAWSENRLFNGVMQYHLTTVRWMTEFIDSLDELDPRTKRKAVFYARQMLSALAPTNFLLTNPKAIEQSVSTGGESLRRGFGRLLDDLERGDGQLRLALADQDAFTLGETIAATPGKVIFENALCQIIQYTATTEQAHQRPLLIVPPWINKYYVLDLQARNSFIRYAVEQGHTVFVLSWINPDEQLAGKNFEDYMIEGPIAALDAIERATGERQINALGYCIGGTLLACSLAWMADKGDDRIASATFFTTMVDFSDPGELAVFIGEEEFAILDRHMERSGYLDGAQMANVFNSLRENDLYWSAFVNSYLMGKDPPAFDILYWNSDSTRMPAMMHRFYLREMYLRNRLRDPGGITLAGVPIDLSKISVPTYILAARDDHIAPWTSTYAATGLYSGPKRFVLAESGHIVGVINPPASKKYGYWLNAETAGDHQEWLAGSSYQQGSWWPDWCQWVGDSSGGSVKARVPGDGALQPIEDAPGRYVHMRYHA